LDVSTVLSWYANGATTAALAAVFTGNDTIVGGTQSDKLIGFGPNTTFTGGGGNDYIQGGGGINTATYSSTAANYRLVQNSTGWFVTDARPNSPDGTETLVNVQNLKFSDLTVNLGLSDAPTVAMAVDVLRSGAVSQGLGVDVANNVLNATQA
jgi:Ca2+-binding RTX toxin-like protein